MPAEPKDMPKFEDSHELDMKKLREPHKHKATAPPANGPNAKRPTHQTSQAAPHAHEPPKPMPPIYDHQRYNFTQPSWL